MDPEQILPADIEKRGFGIITEGLGSRILDPENRAVIERVIHTTADFDYVDNLTSSPHAVTKGLGALRLDTPVITDTNMGRAEIDKAALHRTGSEVYCFVADEDVARAVREASTTRATASVDKTAALSSQGKDCIFVIGSAPTVPIRIKELMDQGKPRPRLIIAIPVGFVSVVQAKELILDLDIPYIVARGRKSDGNVTTTICNVLLYQLHI